MIKINKRTAALLLSLALTLPLFGYSRDYSEVDDLQEHSTTVEEAPSSNEVILESTADGNESTLPTAHDPVIPEEEEENPDTEKTEEVRESVILDVPYINQRNGFPNGCESVSAVMALQYFGVEIDADTFIEKYLDMGKSLYWKNGEGNACDPREMFPGDPRMDSGWGCYPEVIKKAIDKMELSDLSSYVLKDASLSTLCSEYIDNGIPVVFWGTIDMRRPSSWVTWRIDDGSGRTHTWTSPFHCLLLVGYDSEYYYFNDPWRSKARKYDKRAVEIAYSGMGREALVIVQNKIEELEETTDETQKTDKTEADEQTPVRWENSVKVFGQYPKNSEKLTNRAINP